MKTRTLFLTLLASILPLIFGLFVSVADANTKIAPTVAGPGHPFTIIDTPEGRLIDGSVAVFKLGGLEVVLPGRTHKPHNTMQGRLAPDMIGGEYTVFVRQPNGSEFEIGLFTVLGAPTYSNASLVGDYLFIFKEISGPFNLTFCDQAGTLSFDGVGTALVDGISRCSDGTNVTTTPFSGTKFYEVNSDGSFTLGDQPDPAPLHGQIVLDGNSLLLDGTLAVSSTTQLIKQVVAMKRVTVGSPPDYSNASLSGNFVSIFNEIFGDFSPIPIFREDAATNSFNGDGTALVDGTSRDADGTSVTTTPFSGMIFYDVNPDGSFTLGEQADPAPLHGQIVLDGNAALLDGTLSGGGQLFKQAVGMKKVTAGSPPTYSNASLEGDYLFTFNEILFNEVPNLPPLVFIDEAGTLSFDGNGTALVNSTQRWTDGTTITTTSSAGTQIYEVNPDESFTLGEQVGDPRALHGQITLDGTSLLLDGTLDVTSAGQLIKQGVAMKR
jgi:hypothetical protein